MMDHSDMALKEKTVQAVLQNFFTKEGKLTHLPAQLKKKLIVLEHLVSQLEQGASYSEKQINEYIKKYDDDYATIRREFIIYRFMSREDGIYTVNPPEMWTRWDSLK